MKRTYSSSTASGGDDAGGRTANKKQQSTCHQSLATNNSSKLLLSSSASFWNVILDDDEAVVWKNIHTFLPWKDAITLSVVNQPLRKLYKKHCDIILQPLLTCLDSLMCSNVHQYCRKLYAPRSIRTCTCDVDGELDDYYHPNNLPHNQPLAAMDPRYKDTYDDGTFDYHDKCGAMVMFISTVVSNLRQYIQMDINDIANPNKTPNAIGTIQGNWSLGYGVRANALIYLYPLRATLAFNLALLCMARGTLETGNNYDFENAVRGIGDVDPGGSSFSVAICEKVEGMVPFNDESFINMVQSLLPTTKQRDLLGESLTRRLILTAPLMDWVVGQDLETNLLLPRMERFHSHQARRAMTEWGPHDDGHHW